MIGQGMAAAGAALALLAAASGSAQGPWILTCSVAGPAGAPAAAATSRVFRIGTGLLQEWRPAEHEFGTNLCLAHPCVAEKGRLEGVISSASLILTIGLNPENGTATWRTVGASNLAATSGTCAMKLDTAKPKARG
jgi:hypothetical protein